MAHSLPAHPVLELRPGDGIDSDTANRAPLVGFNLSGKRLPLVCVRAWRLDVDNYRNIASALGPDQPIYTAGPPAGGKSEMDFPRDTPEWAEHFTRALGPILEWDNLILAGWSYSGVIALHMAEQLAARGKPPLLVNLFDSTMPVAKPRGDSRKRTGFHKFVIRINKGMEIQDPDVRRQFFENYAKDQFHKIIQRRRWELQTLGRRLLGREVESHPDLTKKKLRAMQPIDPHKKAIRVSYLKPRPPNSTLPVTLYWTEESQAKLTDSSLGRSMRMQGQFRAYPISGDHHSLFLPENIGPLTDALSEELERTSKKAHAEPRQESVRSWSQPRTKSYGRPGP